MRRIARLRRFLAIGLLALGATVWTVGCEQQEGERCQDQGDCKSPLVCNRATLTCTNKSSSGQIDAMAQDGPPPDAAIDAIDAPIDATIDASIDASIN